MKRTWRTSIGMISLVMVWVFTSCSGTIGAGPQARPEPNGTTTAAPSDNASVPVPARPSQPCEVSGTDDAQRLVNLGDAVALVKVSVSQSPTSMAAATMLIPVDSQTLIAGTLPNGPVESLEEAGEILSPGNWLVLVGNAPESPSTYFISDAPYGVFSLNGAAQALELCPGSDPTTLTAAPSGPTVGSLASWFQTAFRNKDGG